MPAADPTFIRAAMEASATLLYAVTAMVILFGILTVVFSFGDRRVPAESRSEGHPQIRGT